MHIPFFTVTHELIQSNSHTIQSYCIVHFFFLHYVTVQLHYYSISIIELLTLKSNTKRRDKERRNKENNKLCFFYIISESEFQENSLSWNRRFF